MDDTVFFSVICEKIECFQEAGYMNVNSVNYIDKMK